MDQVSGPLAGLLVADFSRVLAGPYCTMILGDLGADVIKVEGPGGDDTRHWMPPVREGISTYYLSINRNKRSIQLNLRDEADRAAAAELARRADIMVENFKPGGLRQFGLDYESVRADQPVGDLRVHHRLRRRWRRAPAWLRPDRRGDVRAHEPPG